MLWTLFGIIGLLLITYGILLRDLKLRDEIYVVGGISLLIYSISIMDWIFIILQAVFICVAIFDITRKKIKKK